VRVELHRIAGREQDKLLLQDQDQIAAALDFEDADALMAAVSAAGRQIAWVSDDVWRRRRLWDPTPAAEAAGASARGPAAHRRGRRPGRRGPDMVDIDGEIALLPTAPVSEDTSLAFRLAATAAELDRPIAKGVPAPPGRPHAATGRPVAPRGARPPCCACWPPGARPSTSLESLDQHGLLVRLIPEWAAVRNKPQRNAYHTYTVDRHLLEAAALAAGLTDRVERPDLLLIGALLHDIGKGFPGDHTKVGMEVVRRMATRMGFGPDDVEILVDMVRHHLLLPDTATRRDLDDPTTVANVARAAGNRVTLHLLGALTEADSRATGPSAWGMEGRAGGRAGHAGRPRAGRRGADGRPDPSAYRAPDGGGAQPAGSPRSPSTRPRWSWPHPTARACSRPSPARWRCTAWTCGPPT
jgi:[protein-PII] uridylyltransferase